MNDKDIIKYEIYLAGKSLSPITRRNYIKTAKNFLKYINKDSEQLTQDDIDQYIRYHIRTHTHNGNATRFRTLKGFFNFLKKDFDIPMLSIKETDKAVLNEEQTQKLFDTVKHMSARHRLIFYLEYDGIRRPREICNLKIHNRNHDILHYNGKTHKDHIILTKRLQCAWDDYVNKERPEPQQPKHAPYLILNINNNPGIRGTHLLTTAPLTRVIKEILFHSNVTVPMGENPTNYLIKRTSITRQLKTCPDPKIIQLQAGHANLNITMRYNKVSDDDRRLYFKDLERLDEDYKSPIHSKSRNSVLKTTGDLPQDLNKIKGGELKDNNTSFSFSVSFFNNIGTEKVCGLIQYLSHRSPSLNDKPCPCTSEMPMGVFF